MTPCAVTLDEAKRKLREGFTEGTSCLCCGQYVKEYSRTISASMAYVLIKLFNHSDGQFKDVAELVNHNNKLTNDFAKLRFWDLIEREPGKRDDGSNRVGRWRITDTGREFAANEIRVKKNLMIYNNKITRNIDSEMVSIKDCLKNKFNYSELIS